MVKNNFIKLNASNQCNIFLNLATFKRLGQENAKKKCCFWSMGRHQNFILSFTDFYQFSSFKLKNWVHTILGMVELTLQNCPVESAGRNIPHKYYILRPRSAKSKVKGHLQLYVAYVNDGTEPPRCVLTNFFLSILKFYPLDSQNTKKKTKTKMLIVFKQQLYFSQIVSKKSQDNNIIFYEKFKQ